MASTLMASQTLILQNPTLSTHRTEFNPNIVRHHHHHHLSSYSTPKLNLSHSSRKPKRPTIIASCSTLSTNLSQIENPPHSLLTGSCRTVTTLLGIVLAASKIFAHKVLNLAMQLKSGPGLAQPLIYSAGPAFFAAIRDTSPGTLNTPLTVVAAGMAKWLDIYSGVLMVRVLLSWFPNIPWDRQPLSAIRDLCDPYLNLFRNIIPPIFDTLDVSPLMAFGVLGVLGSILSSTRGY